MFFELWVAFLVLLAGEIMRRILDGVGRLQVVFHFAIVFAAILWVTSIQPGGLRENLLGAFALVILFFGPLVGGMYLFVNLADSPSRVDWDTYDNTEAENVENDSATHETPGKASTGTNDPPGPSEPRTNSSDSSTV